MAARWGDPIGLEESSALDVRGADFLIGCTIGIGVLAGMALISSRLTRRCPLISSRESAGARFEGKARAESAQEANVFAGRYGLLPALSADFLKPQHFHCPRRLERGRARRSRRRSRYREDDASGFASRRKRTGSNAHDGISGAVRLRPGSATPSPTPIASWHRWLLDQERPSRLFQARIVVILLSKSALPVVRRTNSPICGCKPVQYW